MMSSSKLSLCAGAAFGLSGVVLGAWGAHGLAAVVGHSELGPWDTAVLYQFVHALALLVVGLLLESDKSRALRASAVLFALGICLFSGSLYALMLGAPGWMGPITPLGGAALIAGWGVLLFSIWRR